MREWGGVVYQDNAHLRGPLGLVLAPNGDLITANGDAVNPDPTQPSELVEFTPRGQFRWRVLHRSVPRAQRSAWPSSNVGGVLRLAAVEDVTNSLDVWTFKENSRFLFSRNDDSAIGSAALDASFVTTIGIPSGSETGTSAATILSTGDLQASPQSAAIDQLFRVTQESDVPSTLFSHRRVRWGQS